MLSFLFKKTEVYEYRDTDGVIAFNEILPIKRTEIDILYNSESIQLK